VNTATQPEAVKNLMEAFQQVESLQKPPALVLPSKKYWKASTSIPLCPRQGLLRILDERVEEFEHRKSDYDQLVARGLGHGGALLKSREWAGSRRFSRQMDLYLLHKHNELVAYERLRNVFWHGCADPGSGIGNEGIPQALARWKKTFDYDYRVEMRKSAVDEFERHVATLTAQPSLGERDIHNGLEAIENARKANALARPSVLASLRAFIARQRAQSPAPPSHAA
jgi:hypothetical protein